MKNHTYHFTLVLENAAPDTDGLEDRLFEAGCGDALICSYNRTVYLEFDREALTAEDALISAIEDINKAGFSVSTIQESGVASVSEMASRAQVGRSTINNYTKGTRGDGTFPAPLFGLASGSPLYSWPEVAKWLHEHGKLKDETLEVCLAAQSVSFGFGMLKSKLSAVSADFDPAGLL